MKGLNTLCGYNEELFNVNLGRYIKQLIWFKCLNYLVLEHGNEPSCSLVGERLLDSQQ
jgi:hypothetical protein